MQGLRLRLLQVDRAVRVDPAHGPDHRGPRRREAHPTDRLGQTAGEISLSDDMGLFPP